MIALKSLQQSTPKLPQHFPFQAEKQKYDATIKYAEVIDLSGYLATPEVTRIQQIIGKFYYYAGAVDKEILSAVGELATTQNIRIETKKVAYNFILFLNYANTRPYVSLSSL